MREIISEIKRGIIVTKLVKGTMFSKSGALCLFLSLLFPIGAIILSFCLVNKKNIRVINIAIAISVFAIFTTIPLIKICTVVT